jgi:Transcription elongation factor, GreA/GreB, C-term
VHGPQYACTSTAPTIAAFAKTLGKTVKDGESRQAACHASAISSPLEGARANTKAVFNCSLALLSAKSLNEVVEPSSAHVRKQFEQCPRRPSNLVGCEEPPKPLSRSRIADLEDKLSRAEIVDVSKLSGDTIKFGVTVTLIDDDTGGKRIWQIVGEPEANPSEGKISVTSPIARALIGKTKGTTVLVDAPGGIRPTRSGT